jgi:hypothetical protein
MSRKGVDSPTDYIVRGYFLRGFLDNLTELSWQNRGRLWHVFTPGSQKYPRKNLKTFRCKAWKNFSAKFKGNFPENPRVLHGVLKRAPVGFWHRYNVGTQTTVNVGSDVELI